MRRSPAARRARRIGRDTMQAFRQPWVMVAVMLLVIIIAGCKGGDGGTSPTTTATLDLINDTNTHHIGDEVRTDFVVILPEGKERNYSFALSGKPQSGSLQLNVFHMDSVGADVLVNGVVVVTMPPPSPDGPVSASIPTVSLLEGQNTLTIRSRSDASGLAEDFEYNNLKVTVTIIVST